MSFAKHLLLSMLLALLTAGCADLDPQEMDTLGRTRVELVDVTDGSRSLLDKWEQVGCDSMTGGCTYLSEGVGTDSVRITASVQFEMLDSLEGNAYSMTLNFSRIFEKNHPGLEKNDSLGSTPSPLLASPQAWWEEFFVGSQWTENGRSASLSFVSDVPLGTGFFDNQGEAYIWINRADRFIGADGRQWTAIDGEFAAPLLQAGLSNFRYKLENGRFLARLPLE